MKRKIREKTKEITCTVLHILFVTGACTVAGMLTNGRWADKLLRGLLGFSADRIKETLRRLKLQDMIDYDEEDDHSPIVLTTKGIKRASFYEFSRIFSDQKKWDHFWRMVLFDIPERTGKRRMFQRALRQAGFYRMQNSVYLSPFDVTKDVSEFAKLYGLTSSVVISTTTSVGRHEKKARQHFFNRT